MTAKKAVAGKKRGGPRGPRNWVESQKRFVERAIRKASALAARTAGDMQKAAIQANDALVDLLSAVGSLAEDYRPEPKRSGLKVGDEVFMQEALREKYGTLVSPKSAAEPMRVEQIDGRRVRLKLAGGESLILPVNLLSRKN